MHVLIFSLYAAKSGQIQFRNLIEGLGVASTEVATVMVNVKCDVVTRNVEVNSLRGAGEKHESVQRHFKLGTCADE